MFRVVLVLYILLANTGLFASSENTKMLVQLNKSIELRSGLHQIKEQKIELLKQELLQGKHTSARQLDLLSQILEEYALYHYDSAFTYALKLNGLSHEIKQKSKIELSRISFGTILTARGLFHEADDTLSLINIGALSSQEKLAYYKIKVKLYFDLEHYSNDIYYAQYYKNKALVCIDSILLISRMHSLENDVYTGLKYMVTGYFAEAKAIYQKVLLSRNLNRHQQAQYSATLGFINKIENNTDLAIKFLMRAAYFDNEICVKEATAMRGLAEMMYENGEVELAYKYIVIAKQDAEFYGAKHRQLEISSIFSAIEGAYLNLIDTKRKQMLNSVLLVTVLSLIALIALYYALIQNKKLKKARKQIINKNISLENLNTNLYEVNAVKEQYIGYYFNISSEYIDRIEKLKKSIERQLKAKQYDKIKQSIAKVDSQQEREKLFKNFDKVFLKIFPAFIKDYNELFDSKHQVFSPDQTLSNVQRIFALIRIGVSDNEKIAQILDFSVNTVYAYKTKEKNKSIVPNDEFEARIMAIKSA